MVSLDRVKHVFYGKDSEPYLLHHYFCSITIIDVLKDGAINAMITFTNSSLKLTYT